MSRRNSASTSRSLLHRYPNVHYALNAYNSAVHHYNQEVRAAAGGLSAPAAPPTRHLDKARADFLAAVATLPDAESRKVYMDEYEQTHVERYNGPSKRRKKSSPADLYADTDYAAGTSYEDGPESLHLRELLAETKAVLGKSSSKKSAAKRAATKRAVAKSDLVMTPALARAIAMQTKEKEPADFSADKSNIRENRRRKNASFTGKRHTPASTLLEAFYAALNKRYPGNTPIPIPPLETVHTKHGPADQALIFADFTVRKIAPIALEKQGVEALTLRFVESEPITDFNSADSVSEILGGVDVDFNDNYTAAELKISSKAYNIISVILDYAYRAVDGAKRAVTYARSPNAAHQAHGEVLAHEVVVNAERCICIAAQYDFDGTWNAVNEMLQAL